MRKPRLRPPAAGGGIVRPEKRGRTTENGKKNRIGTPARLAIAALVAGILAIGVGQSFKADLTAFAQSAPDPVQPAPFDALVIPSDAHLKGAWSEVGSWPLIAVHLAMTPDGRVLSYGTDGTGRQTGYFTYDVWDPQVGLGGGHMTLSNGTGTDIFCSSQILLPQSGSVFLAGGDNWTGTATTNTGNNNTTLFDYNGNSLTRGNNMNRPRWYSTSTTLLNGEVYIQGGTGGPDRPEVRQTDGSFRLLSNANTSALDFMYPRNYVAPDGRVFDGVGIEM